MSDDTIYLAIPGVPQHKERARRGKGGRWYTPDATASGEQRLRAAWLQQRKGSPWTGPVSVVVRAYFTPPPSWPRWRREAAIREEWPHLNKPDGDNLFKLVADALNGHAWLDDSQVFDERCVKRWSNTPRTVVEIHLHPPLPHTQAQYQEASA